MYGWIWRKLPGNRAWKTLESVVLAVLVSAILVVAVFPWVEPKLPFSGNTVSGDTEPVEAPEPSTSASPTARPSTTSVPSPSDTDTDPGGDVLPGD